MVAFLVLAWIMPAMQYPDCWMAMKVGVGSCPSSVLRWDPFDCCMRLEVCGASSDTTHGIRHIRKRRASKLQRFHFSYLAQAIPALSALTQQRRKTRPSPIAANTIWWADLSFLSIAYDQAALHDAALPYLVIAFRVHINPVAVQRVCPGRVIVDAECFGDGRQSPVRIHFDDFDG